MKTQKKGRSRGPKLQDGRLNDFSGGMNNTVHPAMLNENESALVQNYSLDEKGTLFPVIGRKKRYADGAILGPVNGIGEYNRSDGVSKLLIGSGSNLYVDLPRLVEDYATQANWESGLLSAVTATETPGEIKPLSDITPTFARASTAYLSDGTDVASGIPRYGAGQFGQAVMVEDGTTNLLTANQASVETDTTGFVVIGTTISKSSEQSWHGNSSLKCISDGAGTNRSVRAAGVSGLNGVTYTGSVYVKAPLGTSMDVLLRRGTTVNIASFSFTATGEWQRIIVTLTLDADTTDLGLWVRVLLAEAVTYYIDGLQIEQKPYATSWHLPGTARASETLAIPTAGVLSVTEGTWEQWVYINNTARRLGGLNNIFIIPRGNAPTTTGIEVRHLDTTQNWQLITRDDAGNVTGGSTPDSNTPDGWHLFSVTWSASKAKLFIDGVLRVTSDSPNLPSSFHSNAYVGSKETSGHLNALHDDIRISSRARSDQEIADAYTANLPLPVDEWTTCKMNIDGNLNVQFMSRWESPAIDVSQATNKASGNAALDAVTPGTSSAAISSRSSADQLTWSAWAATLADGTLQHPANDYIQIAIQLIKDGINRPSAQKLTISFDGAPSVTLSASVFTAGGQFYFGSLLDTIAIVNGLDAPHKYDGDILGLLGGSPPRGSYVAAHKNRLWMLKGSRLYFSDLLDIESWPILNFIDISPNDGDSGTGIYPSGDYLVITKSRSVWLLVGDSIDTYSVRRMSATRGCMAPRSLTMVNDMLCMVSDDGVYFSDFTQTVLASERLRVTWNGLNHRRLTQAVAWFHKQKLYVCLPSAGSRINDTTIVFDSLRQAWYVISGWGISSTTLWTEAGKQVMLLGHSNEGQVTELNSGQNNAGLPIEAVWESKHFDMGYPDVVKRFRDITFMVTPDIQDIPLEVQFIVDGGTPTAPITVIVPGRPDKGVEVIRIDPSVVGVGYARSIGFRVRQATLDAAVGIRGMAMYFYPVADRPTIRA